jgi:hypothetical protein
MAFMETVQSGSNTMAAKVISPLATIRLDDQ